MPLNKETKPVYPGERQRVVGHSEPTVESPFTGRETEEVLSGALKITERGIVKRSYGSI